MKSNWYQQTISEVVQALDSDAKAGLSVQEAQARLAEVGPNELVEKAGRSRREIIIEQLSGVLTILLLIAVLISAFLGDWLEAVVILIIVVLNAILGYTQEYRAEQSMAALKRMSVPQVRVRRGGAVHEVKATELAPGDVVMLETGNIVPADGRVLQSINMRVEEAALTGESEPVDKEADLLFDSERALGDRRNMVYSGTIVNYGRGEFMVTETGMATELGHIATLIQNVAEEKTPLQQRLDNLGKLLAYAALGLVAVVFLLGLAQGNNDIEELLLTSVSLAVAAVPEALTAAVTIALSLGAQRMLKRNALIRELPAVETLGSVTVICSDKTGTLTLNRMTVTAVDVANHDFNFVQTENGDGLALRPADDTDMSPGARPSIELLLVAGALCNDASLVESNETGRQWRAVGDPTEGALVLAAAQVGFLKDQLDAVFPRLAEAPFDSVRKRMTTLHATPSGIEDMPASLTPVWLRRTLKETPPYVAFTKGAIDGLLDISTRVWVDGDLQPLDEAWRTRIMADHNQMADKGMRVLAVGLRPWEHPPEKTNEAALEEKLILIGLFGMIDPPRPEVMDAVADCRRAGIRPVMITGDHPLTARHIAQQIGITENDHFLTGQDLDRLTDDELLQATEDVSVFARVSPAHKLNLIDAFKRQGQIVAMTGDGVNDAPALKMADIGVAMGITGTDVAKGAASMVLLDDNFATIVAAVEEGRVIYDNIRRFIKYLLTCNASEILVMLMAPFLGMPLALLPLQILWMNLVTDGLPALALGVEPAEKNVLRRPPYSATESVLGRGMVQFIVVVGIIISLLAMAVGFGLWSRGSQSWQTVLFTTLVFAQLAVAIAARSEAESVFSIGFFTNRSMVLAVLLTIALQLVVIYLPAAQKIFTTVALTAEELALTAAISLLTFVVVEIWKTAVRLRRRRRAAVAV